MTEMRYIGYLQVDYPLPFIFFFLVFSHTLHVLVMESTRYLPYLLCYGKKP
jgi:hypothetical protein